MSVSQSDTTTLPVALLAVAFILLLGFQTVQLSREGRAISQVRAAQEPTVQEGLRLRTQLNSIAGKTAALAAAGDAAAKAIIDDMRKLGISVKPTP